MGDKSRGIYQKFKVERTDGTSEPGKKHDGCGYFVLDVTHDPFARAALLAYAESCASEYPLLAADVRRMADGLSVAKFPARSAPAAQGAPLGQGGAVPQGESK